MRRWQTFSLFVLSELVCTKKCYLEIWHRYLEIWHLLFVPHRTYTNCKGDSLFLPFCTIGISMYQKSTLPYTLFLTYLPQAHSLLERCRLTDWLTDKVLHPLFPNSFFFPLSARSPTRRRKFTWLAELRGGWPIEPVKNCTAIGWHCLRSSLEAKKFEYPTRFWVECPFWVRDSMQI